MRPGSMNVRKKKVAKRLLRSCTRPAPACSEHGSGDVHPWNSGTRAGSNGVCFLGRFRKRGLRPPGPGAPVIVSKANPISTSLVSLLRVCAGARVDLLVVVVVAVQGAIRIIENSGKRSQLCTPFVDACDSFAAPHWFFPLVLEHFECMY